VRTAAERDVGDIGRAALRKWHQVVELEAAGFHAATLRANAVLHLILETIEAPSELVSSG
jgi:hypothetical protein